MLDEDDLDAAVAEGVLSAPQAVALRDFALKRQKERVAVSGPEERFRFMRGFNDFFFAVGILLFGGGMAFFAVPTPAGSLIAAAVTWALAELLVARMRLVLPGILLACIFVAFIVIASPVEFWLKSLSDLTTLSDWFLTPRKGLPNEMQVIALLGMIYGLVGAVAAAAFYARFRLPFVLLLVAGCLVGAALAATYHVWPKPAKLIESLVLLGCGIVVFAAAMGFDVSDRERVTRRADCAFWLHLLAAPLIVHSLITLVTADVYKMTTPVALTILAIFAVLTIVAVVIDRRALLVSALIYIGVVIAYGVKGAVGVQSDKQPFVFFTTLLVLGTVVLIIGVGWMPLRRCLLAILPAGLVGRLPPVPVRP